MSAHDKIITACIAKKKHIPKIENIDRKIAGLKERGFKNPIRVITSLPTILGLAFENIDSKIYGLRERGFKNPIKMIASSPSILGLTFENIDQKIKYLQRVGNLYKIDSLILIEAVPSVFGCSIKKIGLTVYILYRYCKTVPSVSTMRCALFCPIQKLILTSLENKDLTINELIKISRKRNESMSDVVYVLNNERDKLSRQLCC